MIRAIRVTNVPLAASRLVQDMSQKNRSLVESIFKSVQRDGDAAVRRYEKKFGGSSPASLRVSKKQIDDSFETAAREEIRAIRLAKARLEKTERAVKSILQKKSIVMEGVRISKRFLPIQSVGCYVPGGLARYPSSAVMSIVPAKIAGVRRIVVVSPPGPDGRIDPLTVVAASMCGAAEIYQAGGAQAIAALALGTKTIPRVDKIVGPGGSFVTMAKSVASRHTSIDMLAGPTELGIIADCFADPRHVALDLISQSEHSSDTRCYVITDSPQLAGAVRAELSNLVSKVKRRDIVRKSLEQNGFVAVCRSQDDVSELANMLAPEHLQIMTKSPRRTASKITTPGLVLLGSQSPSSASDYLLGSNHILPTNGFGRTRGPLSVLDFVKLGTEITASKRALAGISRHMRILTGAEGLPNHYEAVRGRLQ